MTSRGLALLVAGAYFMEIMDATVIAPAAPHIAADLGVAAVDINVAITAYVLTLAVLIPVSGWLADRFVKPVTAPLMRRFGIRAVMLTAILASAACLVGMAFVTAATPLPLLLVLLWRAGCSGRWASPPTTASRSPTSNRPA